LGLSIVSQVLGGIGGAFNSVSSMSLLIAYSKKSERENNIGLLETCVGLGLLMGPLLGSILYNVGGYSMPFAAMALTYVIMVPIVISSLRIAAEEHKN
jgi:MFS family permease